MSVKGIDLSSNNGETIDFRRIYQDGFRFCIIKATQGTTYRNPYVNEHAHAAKRAGLIVGAYAFLDPSAKHSAQAEADHFLSVAHDAGLLKAGCLRPTVDIEATGLPKGRPSRRYDYRVIERVIQRMGGTHPFIYTGSWFWDGVLQARNAHKCPLWLAAYVPNWRRFIPGGFDHVAIHQYSDKGASHGVRGPVDLDLYLGTSVKMLRSHHCLRKDH